MVLASTSSWRALGSALVRRVIRESHPAVSAPRASHSQVEEGALSMGEHVHPAPEKRSEQVGPGFQVHLSPSVR